MMNKVQRYIWWQTFKIWFQINFIHLYFISWNEAQELLREAMIDTQKKVTSISWQMKKTIRKSSTVHAGEEQL